MYKKKYLTYKLLKKIKKFSKKTIKRSKMSKKFNDNLAKKHKLIVLITLTKFSICKILHINNFALF